MALYGTLSSLSTTAASNAADGSTDAPSTIDNQMNLLASFSAQLRDAAGGYRSFKSTTAATVLDATYFGAMTATVNGPYTVTLPAASTALTAGSPTISLINLSGNTQTVSRGGADTITMPDLSSVTTFSLKAGESVTLVSNGVNGWNAVSGTVAAAKSAGFKFSFALSGYQTLPSGLIVQWGSTTGVTGGASSVAITFPLAFPTFVLVATGLCNGDSGATLATPTVASGTTSASGFSAVWTTGSAGIGSGVSVRTNWVAFGY